MSELRETILEEFNNLALMLVISDKDDLGTLDQASKLLLQIKSLLGEFYGSGDQSVEISDLVSETLSKPLDQQYDSMKKLVSRAQSILNGDSGQQSSEKSNLVDVQENQEAKINLKCENQAHDMLEGFYESHKSFINEIIGKFEQIRTKSYEDSKMPADFHQEVESYVLRLNQDATKHGSQALVDIAQRLFMLLMQYPLVDIYSELKLVGDFVLDTIESLKNGKSSEGLVVPSNIKEILDRIEGKLSGLTPLEEKPIGNQAVDENIEEKTSTASKAETYVIDADREILSEFIAEATDHINAVEGILLERDLEFSSEDVDTLFRGVHSLKGTSSYFNLLEINESSHLLENILDEVRKGERELNQSLKSLILRYVDIQNKLLESADEAVSKDCVVTRSTTVSSFIKDVEDFFNNKQGTEIVKDKIDSAISNVKLSTHVLEQEVRVEDNKEFEKVEAVNSVQEASKEAKKSKQSSSKDTSTAKSFVKIDTDRLDSLGEMIGEMVIYSSMLVKRCRDLLPTDESTMRMSDQVEKFSRELQDIGMSMRLDPIRGLFQKLSRLVWDTSKKLGKEIKFEVSGEDTELDRNVIERLADPLMHMVRNSLDHGIEDPNVREASGKDRVGVISLSSSHEGGSIVIKIKDDGKGLDPKKLFQKAVEKGIVSKDANLTDVEIYQLIFAPGFSTAEKVTDISGRGVGMDVVRTNIEAMRGVIHIDSKLGFGTTFSIELPLTLAIIEGIEASVGKDKFIFPMLSVVELTKPSTELIGSSLHSDETFLFRGRHLPMFRLSDIFSAKSKNENVSDGSVIILNNGGELVAVLVDEIGGNCQTVIKSLGPLFEKQSGIAGCAIVNNGDIGLIIDVRSLIQIARQGSSNRKESSEKRLSA